MLGVMVVTLMAMFLMAAGVFAVGEQIRDRIEMQNAVDAAAYAAAVVQADTLSRIAAINQAMAWTYVQMARRHIHYITAEWIVEVDATVRPHYQDLENHQWTWWSTVWQNGLYTVWINRNFNTTLVQLRGMRNTIVYNFVREGLSSQITEDRAEINRMREAQRELMDELPRRIRETAHEVLRVQLPNLDASRYKVFIGPGSADRVVQLQNRHNYGEVHFLSSIGLDTQTLVNQALGPGATFGTQRQWFRPAGGANPWRNYTDDVNGLIAEWSFNRKGKKLVWGWWQHNTIARNGTVRGSHARRDDPLFQITSIEPLGLPLSFFEGDGTIIVACAQRLRHPFQIMIDAGGGGGFYDAFRNEGGRHMVAIAAARAGYRDGLQGGYNPFSDSNATGWYRSRNNLGVTDWDAVLIPLRRAWVGRTNGGWNGDSGVQVLDAIRDENQRWNTFDGGTVRIASNQLPGAQRVLSTGGVLRTGFGRSSVEWNRSLRH